MPQCPRPFCLLGLGLLVAEVLVFLTYERAARLPTGLGPHGAERERSLEQRLRNATRANEALAAALEGARSELARLRQEKAAALSTTAAASPRPLRANSSRHADPGAQIRHAPLGECGGRRPRGLLQPDCRWAWDDVPRPRLIVEFGGNQGDDLKHFADLHPEAVIHSFEPVKKYFEILRRDFSDHPRVRLHQVGASDADAQVSFRTDGDVAAASEFGTAKGEGKPVYEEVSLRDAHALLEAIVLQEGREIEVLSVNCEGCEYSILERLSKTGWLSRLRYLQVSWHTSSEIPRRHERRCGLLEKLSRTLRPAYQADFGWEGYSSAERPYAVDERFLGSLAPADAGRGNGIGHAQGGIACPPAGAESEEPPLAAGRLEPGEDPEAGHLTYPQTVQDDVVGNLLLGQALALPAADRRPLIVEVGAGDGAGVRFRHALAHNPTARVHSFEPVASLRRRLEADARAMNLTAGGRVVWRQGWAAEDGRGRFRAWGASGAEGARWAGWAEEGELWDAGRAMREVERREGRGPDLLYLNCEGCEYEVLQRLSDAGWLKSLPRLAVSWHAGGAPWRRRCKIEALLREGHRLRTKAESYELWALPELAGEA